MLNAQFLLAKKPPKLAQRWVIGLSGGLDSTALLHMCVRYREIIQPDLQLLAVHVNHHISDSAIEWQNHCETLCHQLGVECHSVSVVLEQQGRKSLEQIARDKRYQVFEQVCTETDLLVLGHHLDDQIETLLYRLVRGSGALGLRGMEEYTERNGLCLWRPLLAVPRAALESYVAQQELPWVEDPSNRDLAYDRNFIRHEVVPLLTSRWPSVRKTLGRSSRLLKESAELANELALLDLRQCQQQDQLVIGALQKLSQVRQKNCIRFWLQAKGAMLPSEKVLEQVIDCVQHYHEALNADISWAGDSSGSSTVRWQIHTFRGELYADVVPGELDATWCGELNESDPLVLPGGLGRLSLGEYAEGSQDTGRSLLIADAYCGEALKVTFRQGGEQFRPVGRKQKLLKKWLQDWGVPPWERDRIPLIYSGDRLIAVMGQALSEGCQPLDGESGQIIRWTP